MAKKTYRINRQITAEELRVIGDDGTQLGVFKIDKAFSIAWEKDLDLVEIAPSAQPPVAKIVDFKKFLYEEKRKEREAKKKLKEVELKEIRLGPFISDHDLETRLEQAREFLNDGNHVKITVKFKGRQMGHTEFGYKLIEKVKEILSELAKIEKEERLEGRNLNIFFAPGKNAKTKN